MAWNKAHSQESQGTLDSCVFFPFPQYVVPANLDACVAFKLALFFYI
jgi:hypothetical protein